MTRRNPDSVATPDVVTRIAQAVEIKLGRPPYVRQVKNKNEWFITDPMFSFVQHGLRKGATGYRVGYRYEAENDRILFCLVHSPIMAQLFKRNLTLSTLIHVAEATSRFRSSCSLYWDSRSVVGRRKGRTVRAIETDTTSELISDLQEFEDQYGFIRDLFPKIGNQKTGIGPATWAGNTFYLELASAKKANSAQRIASMVKASWPLFLCLYPIEAIEQRVACLARSLKAAKISIECEFTHIKGVTRKSKIDSNCRGTIEGAHIKPHAYGGSDRLNNGLWLCQYHHRETEGKLIGSRGLSRIDVRLTSAI